MNAIPQTKAFCCPSCGGFIGEAAPIEQVRDFVTSPSQRVIFDLLTKSVGRPVLRDTIIRGVYGNRGDGGPDAAATIIMVQVSKLRRILEPFGWTISVSKGGAGEYARWRLIPTEKGA